MATFCDGFCDMDTAAKTGGAMVHAAKSRIMPRRAAA
jgi:hypothetical protein